MSRPAAATTERITAALATFPAGSTTAAVAEQTGIDKMAVSRRLAELWSAGRLDKSIRRNFDNFSRPPFICVWRLRHG